jgi:hypothetical protein
MTREEAIIAYNNYCEDTENPDVYESRAIVELTLRFELDDLLGTDGEIKNLISLLAPLNSKQEMIIPKIVLRPEFQPWLSDTPEKITGGQLLKADLVCILHDRKFEP